MKVFTVEIKLLLIILADDCTHGSFISDSFNTDPASFFPFSFSFILACTLVSFTIFDGRGFGGLNITSTFRDVSVGGDLIEIVG